MNNLDTNSQILIQALFTVIPILIGLFIVYKRSDKENLYKNFDKFFIIAILSVIFGRIVWIIMNSGYFQNSFWNISPFIKVENLETLESYRIWFGTLPWKYFNIFDGNVSTIGVPLGLSVITMLKPNLKDRIQSLKGNWMGVFALFISILGVEYLSTIWKIKYVFTSNNFYLLILSFSIFVILYLLKRSSIKKQNSYNKYVRNEENDRVHELASQNRIINNQEDTTMLKLNRTFLNEFSKKLSNLKRLRVPTKIKR